MGITAVRQSDAKFRTLFDCCIADNGCVSSWDDPFYVLWCRTPKVVVLATPTAVMCIEAFVDVTFPRVDDCGKRPGAVSMIELLFSWPLASDLEDGFVQSGGYLRMIHAWCLGLSSEEWR